MTQQRLSVPEECELLALFGADPVDRQIENGYWCYEVTDPRGVALRFSFNLYEQSIQTVLLVGGVFVVAVSCEAATGIKIEGNKIKCDFSSRGAKTNLTVKVRPQVSVEWSTLRIE